MQPPPETDPESASDGQSVFAAALLDASAPPPPGLVAVDGVPPIKRFAVYRNNVVASLVAALGAAFPTVKKLVGAEFFDAMAGVYVREHPPTSPVMILYGETFPDWAAAFPPAATVPYLGDMARLEWARRDAYHAADADPLRVDAFQRAVADLAPEAISALRFAPHPSLRILRAAHPVFSIWGDANERPMTVEPGGQDILIARPDDQVVMHLLAPGAAAYLAAIAAGAPLGDAAERGAADAPDFDLSMAVAAMLDLGTVSGFSSPE